MPSAEGGRGADACRRGQADRTARGSHERLSQAENAGSVAWTQPTSAAYAAAAPDR